MMHKMTRIYGPAIRSATQPADNTVAPHLRRDSMKRVVYGVVFSFVCSSILVLAQGNGNDDGDVKVPDSSTERPGDQGHKAHTNHVIKVRPNAGNGPGGGLTPAQAASAYGINFTTNAGTIYVVDALHLPFA